MWAGLAPPRPRSAVPIIWTLPGWYVPAAVRFKGCVDSPHEGKRICATWLAKATVNRTGCLNPSPGPLQFFCCIRHCMENWQSERTFMRFLQNKCSDARMVVTTDASGRTAGAQRASVAPAAGAADVFPSGPRGRVAEVDTAGTARQRQTSDANEHAGHGQRRAV